MFCTLGLGNNGLRERELAQKLGMESIDPVTKYETTSNLTRCRYIKMI